MAFLEKKHPRVTLIAPDRLEWACEEVAARQTLEGFVVIRAPLYQKKLITPLTIEEQELRDKLQRKRIGMADTILVLDIGGYMDQQMINDVAAAVEMDVGVLYCSDVYPDLQHESDCTIIRRPVGIMGFNTLSPGGMGIIAPPV